MIVPQDIDVPFLKEFRSLILSQIKRGRKFIIMCGGGKICRKYQKALSLFTDSKEDLDWIGIHSTKLNANLVQLIFKNYSYPEIISNPTKKIKTKKPLLIACGWQPGCSTDYDAVLLAKTHGGETIINLSNVDYVYERDPKEFPGAKPIKTICWKHFLKIIGEKWSPGMNVPFDPIASRLAKKLKIKVIIVNGKNLRNLKAVLEGKPFAGTTVF